MTFNTKCPISKEKSKEILEQIFIKQNLFFNKSDLDIGLINDILNNTNRVKINVINGKN